MSVRVVDDAGGFQDAARLLVDFNAEYGDPAPEAGWLAGHLGRLVASGDTSVLLVAGGGSARGVAVLRFRISTWSADTEAYLAEFSVQPGHRGRGIGTAFLEGVIEHARGRGATYLDLNTSEDDEAARHVYEKRGFDCHEGRGSGPRALYYELELA
ncbi:GNAT family N-acetyltransferase [Herbiconiux sp. CPCC 203407]|uniref:GNAT family N-acetyltransferase n=1 Tax=Herbiconiux oxytropis TaxID=2970915 RepID=A0AA41XCX8_9MICO|nr:GNAT family N-acetyltransferase [Herbiconiux oxytropis]MCS5722165.1 GNAT family N-acetyltransferase [Herbiconiux oxytropis]MCS5725747.1 GNAT family N-acetyltransferase [Herbiconiux oxytropis]